jgi:predicted acyl esterase
MKFLNEPVELDINIQPSATLFRKGETLRVAIQGHDFGEYAPDAQVPRAGSGCNTEGSHIIELHQSYLEVPIIPSHF